jgi:hypothetical protein
MTALTDSTIRALRPHPVDPTSAWGCAGRVFDDLAEWSPARGFAAQAVTPEGGGGKHRPSFASRACHACSLGRHPYSCPAFVVGAYLTARASSGSPCCCPIPSSIPKATGASRSRIGRVSRCGTNCGRDGSVSTTPIPWIVQRTVAVRPDRFTFNPAVAETIANALFVLARNTKAKKPAGKRRFPLASHRGDLS